MSVRQSLLAILDQGPCYGYQLRAEFGRRTGSSRPLNVGQIYHTLERLERDGLVVEGDTDEQGHVYWQITDAGSAAVREWLSVPVARAAGTRDELAVKVSLAATLPGVDVTELIRMQRVASRMQLEALHDEQAAAPDVARALVLDALILAAEAELQWLSNAEARIAQHPRHTMALELSSDKPKRGRPARAVASVA